MTADQVHPDQTSQLTAAQRRFAAVIGIELATLWVRTVRDAHAATAKHPLGDGETEDDEHKNRE